MDYDKPHRRLDLTTRRWVLITSQPIKQLILDSQANTDGKSPSPNHAEWCIYCPGRTQLTHPDIMQFPTENGTIRVTTKKDLKVFVTDEPTREGDGPYDCRSNYGVDETVVIGEIHNERLSTLPAKLLAESIAVCQTRIISLNGDKNLKNLIFWSDGNNMAKNLGRVHPQLHISGADTVFQRTHEEMTCCMRHFEMKERCLFCDIIKEEQRKRVRLVEETEHYLILSPYASRHPFELWIIPKIHEAYFENFLAKRKSDSNHWLELAELIQRILQQLENFLGAYFTYSLVLHNAPKVYQDTKPQQIEEFYHWRLRLKPYLKRQSREEDASGECTNPLSPEEATRLLKLSPREVEKWLK